MKEEMKKEVLEWYENKEDNVICHSYLSYVKL